MTTSSSVATGQRGGGWLLQPPDRPFTPEQLSEEHRLIGRTADQFVDDEVLPQLDRLEQKDWALARRLLQRCGELGLLGVGIPETYGGVPLDTVASLLVSERLGRAASFSTTFGAQTGLCVLPLYLFGSDAQKQRYLPKLVAGELVGAYALSEAGSGSDALGAKARATRQADGSFRLNGEKMWISNGGFADVFVVFAKVDGQQFSAFIVERRATGVSTGNEEHKMGLHGSSTTPLLLQDVRVEADDVLGDIGKGHKVAFNVLNFGRFKLGAMCNGGARAAIGEAVRYAAGRKQFGQPIATFGAIRQKIGEMIVRTYAVESSLYRTGGLIDARLEAASASHDDASELLRSVEEYAVEASIAKVGGSDMLDFVVDENVQIHGGNGFVRDYPAERHYRDARVNRIFEGTNEINRLLISGMLARRAAGGDLPILAAARALQDELLEPAMPPSHDDRPLADERHLLQLCKKVVIVVFGAALQTYRDAFADQQEVLMHLSDMLIDLYNAESAVLRAISADQTGARGRLHLAAARIFVNDAVMRIETSARQALPVILEGDVLRVALAAIRRFMKFSPINTAVLRRLLADEAVSRAGYVF